jgi:hypothetical protein
VRKGELGSCHTTAQWMRRLENDWLPLRKQVMAIQPFYRFFIEIGISPFSVLAYPISLQFIKRQRRDLPQPDF